MTVHVADHAAHVVHVLVRMARPVLPWNLDVLRPDLWPLDSPATELYLSQRNLRSDSSIS